MVLAHFRWRNPSVSMFPRGEGEVRFGIYLVGHKSWDHRGGSGGTEFGLGKRLRFRVFSFWHITTLRTLPGHFRFSG
jgi:hypothetical protein